MDYIELSCKLSPYSTDFADLLIYELGEIGFDSFETAQPFCKAYINVDNFDADIIKKLDFLHENPFGSIEYEINEIKSQNWNEQWESSYKPVEVGNKCAVIATFHEPIPNVEYTIEIEPQMSFGTGHHETTWLMIDSIYDMDVTGKSVADCGCGTGVLAIFACLKKAKEAFAFDIDEWASTNTLDNAKRNGVDNISAVKGGMETLKGKTFDLLFANINKNILIMEMKKMSEALNIGGQILMSGFYDTDIEAIADSAKKEGLQFEWKKHKNKWSICSFVKTQ